MNRDDNERPRPSASPGFDWRRLVCAMCLHVEWATVAQSVLSPDLARMVGDSMRDIGRSIDAQLRAEVEPSSHAPPIAPDLDASEPPLDVVEPIDEEVTQAAALLGVNVTAAEAEIRKALRVRMTSSQVHPDHGGDPERAKELIAAQNLLLDRARARRV